MSSPEPGAKPGSTKLNQGKHLHLPTDTVFTQLRKVLPTVQVLEVGYLNPKEDITNQEIVWLCAMFACCALPTYHAALDWPRYIELHGLRRHFSEQPPAGHGEAAPGPGPVNSPNDIPDTFYDKPTKE